MEQSIRWVVAALAMVLVAWGVGSCAGGALKPSGAGMARGDARQVASILAQTRAQFPHLSVAGIAYGAREEGAGGEPIALVLRGGGQSIKAGIQTGRGLPVEVELHLAMPGYDAGFLKLTGKAGKSEIWRVVAFDHRGRAEDAFEFFYVLSGAGGGLRYLALIGGVYKDGGQSYRGIEGTLIEPDAEGNLETWRRAYKIDFGRRMAAIPAYQTMVAEARTLFKQLRRGVASLKSLRDAAAAAQAQKQASPPRNGRSAPAPAASSQTTASQASSADREVDPGARAGEAAKRVEADALRYFRLRAQIAGAFAAFTESNAYTWMGRDSRQAHYDTWKEVELHHPAIDDLAERLAMLLEDGEKVKAARRSAMSAVRLHNNWDKDPSRPPRSRN